MHLRKGKLWDRVVQRSVTFATGRDLIARPARKRELKTLVAAKERGVVTGIFRQGRDAVGRVGGEYRPSVGAPDQEPPPNQSAVGGDG